MTVNEFTPLELAGRLALALALAVFLGLTFEEVYKREEKSLPGGVRTFPMLALAGAMLYLIESRQGLAFIVGLIALAIWLYAFLRQTSAGPWSLMIPASNLVAYLLGPVALSQLRAREWGPAYPAQAAVRVQFADLRDQGSVGSRLLQGCRDGSASR
jgi:hypothetical protein